ncbi:MAG: barstar family protein [Bacteroidales bacterium]|nr:barstar family protein [Bacteroidales bacterium]
MKTYILNFDNKETAESLHNYLAKMLDLPTHYGHNLDALYDCLTSFTAATTITIANIDESNSLHCRALEVFRDAAASNPKLHLLDPQGNWTN